MEKRKKVLYLDLDGVIFSFSKRYRELDDVTKLGEFKYKDESEEGLRKRQIRVTEVVNSVPHFFQELPLIDGAYEAVLELNKHFEIYFLSTPMEGVDNSYSDKRIHLKNTFGDIAFKKLILSHRKDLNVGDFLVDDRTKNGAGEFTGELVLFGSEEFKGWDVVLPYLIERA